MALLVLIPSAWLVVMTLCLAICRAAARGEAVLSATGRGSRVSLFSSVVGGQEARRLHRFTPGGPSARLPPIVRR